MSLLAALLLGFIQGLTEFLPVSSDGHLATAAILLGPQALQGHDGVFYDVVLHVATLLAVVLYFRRELVGLFDAFKPGVHGALARRVIALIVTASIPTAVVAFAIKGACERAFAVPLLVGLGFLGTALFLASTIVSGKRSREEAGGSGASIIDRKHWYEDLAIVRWRDAVVIGFMQGLAPWPGLSRSATTVSSALWMGVPPVTAARFSLLISLPAIGGAFLLELKDLRGQVLPAGLGVMAAGFVVAGVVGYLAIGLLVRVVRGGHLR